MAAVTLLLAVPVPLPLPGAAATGVADLASLFLVLCCVPLLLRPRPAGAERLSPRVLLVVAVPAVACAVVTVAAGDPLAAVPGFARHLQVFVLIPLALLVALRAPGPARWAAALLLLPAVVQGTVGTIQYLTGTGASYMGEDIRAVGTYGPQNVMGMAGVVAAGMVVAVAFALGGPPRAPDARRTRTPRALTRSLAAPLCAVALLVPLVVSFSRGAWIATAVACAAMLLLAGRLSRRVLLLLACGSVLAVGLAAAGSGQVADRLTSIVRVTDTPDQSVIDRYALWDAALTMWREEPWTGVGPRGFADHRDAAASVALSSGSDTGGAGWEFERQQLLSPHNMYLLVLAEQGLLGATATFGAWAVLLVGCLRRLRIVPPGPSRRLGLAATGLLLWQLVNFLYADIGGPTTVVTGLAFGLAAWWALAPESATGVGDTGARR
ncbi:O-antigen ligase [Streptomyces sp. ST2-7A]|uniref:O-antigen ligase family protein n=1 Tax=Streptomyces sp. ST2-7A TaxID=2907214 RepID=UPI001F455F6A|nr:O-antigen ligase family protein [Streptomyces sp. ST2-7A]MCE7080672.1 O-antigen ligase family protein [Streptomyces sp. ST2-7A]